MSKNLTHYLTESQHWMDNPVPGDNFAINFREECLVESYILETKKNVIVIQADEEMIRIMESYGCSLQDVQEQLSVDDVLVSEDPTEQEPSAPGVLDYSLGEGGIDPNQHPQTRDYGRGEDDDEEEEDLPFRPDAKVLDRDQFGNPIKNVARHLARQGMRQAMAVKEETVEEDYMSRMLELAGMAQPVAETAPLQPNSNAADLAPESTEQDLGTATTIDEAVMKNIATELGEIADDEDQAGLYDLLTARTPAGEMVRELYGEVAQNFRLEPDDDQDIILDRLMDRIVDEFGGQLDEAEYQGRKVSLGKPTRGDSKKFKVYVKDPKTGNVKKVNFGHGGTSAKRAGEKTLSIKKSNPARRRSFRARHNCDNPGPRTKARYWSCRAW